MKVFISIDMEGICGIVSEIETDPGKGGAAYQQSRHLMTLEGNAAIEGCLKAGATEVLIADSHWNFDNLISEELHEAATLLRGKPRVFSMVHDLDASYDAALFVGYHAKAGTPRAILDHTYSGRIASVRVNGTEVGETGINAYLAGHHGVPVVLVTGDWAVTAEAKALIPNIHTVAVKDATGAEAARNLHPKKAREQIRAEATKAVRDAKAIGPIRTKTPVQMVVEFRGTVAADRAAMIPGVRRIGGLRFEFEGNDFPEAFRTFYAMVTIAGDE
jgi:D-amino peptidase